MKTKTPEARYIVITFNGGTDRTVAMLYPDAWTATDQETDEEVFKGYNTVNMTQALDYVRSLDEDTRRSAAIINIRDMLRVDVGEPQKVWPKAKVYVAGHAKKGR